MYLFKSHKYNPEDYTVILKITIGKSRYSPEDYTVIPKITAGKTRIALKAIRTSNPEDYCWEIPVRS